MLAEQTTECETERQGTGQTSALRARLLPMFPLGIVCGGLEVQCLKTQAALERIGVPARLLDYYDAEDRFDILHLFGSTGAYLDLCQQAAGRWKIVVSAVSGAPSVRSQRAHIWQSVSALAHAARLQTSYSSLKQVYHLADAVICLNQLEAEFLRVTYAVPQEKIRIISNGVDSHFFTATGELFAAQYQARDYVLFTGNIVERKNPLQLARVLQRAGHAGVFIGGTLASEQAYAEEFARVINDTPRLLWIRGISPNDPLLASAYAGARVFCLPSSAETQSLSALEAMACSTPVILGDFAYARQIPFEACLRCNPNDEASLSALIEQTMADPERFRIRLSEDYSWDNVARQIIKVYRQIS
jgi:glycosyltransferase involved in cell wall biosynthesis